MAAGQSSTRLVAWLAVTGGLAALAFWSRAQAGAPADNAAYQYGTALNAFAGFALVLGLMLAISIGTSRRELFALRRPARWRAAAGWGAASVAATWVVLGALSPFLDPGEEQNLTPDHWDGSRALPFALTAVSFVVGAAVVEELAFRGAGVTLVGGAWGRTAAVVVPAVLWAAAHGLVEALPALIVFGVGLGILRLRTGSVIPGMIVHAVFNAVALTASLLA